MDASAPVAQHDLLILGAGLSGINTAHVLGKELPHREVTILEARAVLGGTWSFFRYPGFRSDSTMTTFGLKWHPWAGDRKIATAPEIISYLEGAAREEGIVDKIRFRHKVVDCEWREDLQKWRLEVEADGEKQIHEANFVFGCTGYYSYTKAFETVIPGVDQFAGHVVHPQWWPEDLDYANKRIVIVGSGATAVTLLPVLAETAGQVTMLQRSPSYVSTLTTRSPIERFLKLFLPLGLVQWFAWWKDLASEIGAVQMLLNFPNFGRRVLTKEAKKQLPKDVDVDVHFNPSYDPFQQRLCLCPDGDFFKALHRDNCEIVTDVIDTVVSDGIVLKSGRKIEADIIITATGLYFELLGGLSPRVNGAPIRPGQLYAWRGCMLESLPNMVFIMGYVKGTWTLGANAMAKTVVRVIKRMEETGSTSVVPRLERKKGMAEKLAVDATSNYFIKAADRMPKVTGEGPWYGRTNILVDTWVWLFSNMRDGLEYSGESLNKKTA